jgi:hypothetical protein
MPMRGSNIRHACSALVGLAVIAAACSSSSHSAAPTTTSPATSAAPISTTSTTKAATSTSSVPAGPAACTTSQLAVTIGPGNGAAGSSYYALVFRNTGAAPCTLNGYPGVSYVTGSTGTQVGSPATRVPAPGATAQAINVAPGGSAHATLREINVANYPPATCGPTPVLGLRVYPPNQTAAVFVAQATNGCAQTGPAQLEITFVQPGAG